MVFYVVVSLKVGFNLFFDQFGKGEGVAFLAVDSALGVRSGTTRGAAAATCRSSPLGALGSLHLFVFGNMAIVDLAVKFNEVKFLCSRFSDDVGEASSADTTERLAGGGNVGVVVHDDCWAAHLD